GRGGGTGGAGRGAGAGQASGQGRVQGGDGGVRPRVVGQGPCHSFQRGGGGRVPPGQHAPDPGSGRERIAVEGSAAVAHQDIRQGWGDGEVGQGQALTVIGAAGERGQHSVGTRRAGRCA